MSDITTAPPKRRRGRPATGRDPFIGFRAPAEVIAAVRAETARRGVSASDIGREALRAYVDNLKWVNEEEAAKAA